VTTTNEGRTIRPPLDRQPTLTGELVRLEPLRSEDFDALFAVAADPQIWEQHPASDRYQPAVFRAFFEDAMSSGGALIARDAATGAIIGSSRYHDYDADRRQVEIGWTFLARPYWGGRYNAEMKALMLRHAFQSVDRVVFLVGPENWRSQRALEKIGAKRVGERPDAGGRPSVVYEIRRDDFAQGPLRASGGPVLVSPD
jgi:RimJ/RimL family protein N-acetyltransferase